MKNVIAAHAQVLMRHFEREKPIVELCKPEALPLLLVALAAQTGELLTDVPDGADVPDGFDRFIAQMVIDLAKRRVDELVYDVTIRTLGHAEFERRCNGDSRQ